LRIYKVKAWDYAALNRIYEEAIARCREEHVPCLIHVEEVTQPQGHSTSGSHERYKSQITDWIRDENGDPLKEIPLLEWYKVYDCNVKFREWILNFKPGGDPIATEDELDAIEKKAKADVRAAQKNAWNEFLKPLKEEKEKVIGMLDQLKGSESSIEGLQTELQRAMDPGRREIISIARRASIKVKGSEGDELRNWIQRQQELNSDRYGSHLYSESSKSCLKVEEVPAEYAVEEEVDGRIIIRDNFAALFEKEPLLLTFGEDTGKIGDVNQGMEGMQARFGEIRVSDTGIREATILGQGIGMALRGLRPVAEIQYLDYLLYCLQGLSDDLATVQWRSK